MRTLDLTGQGCVIGRCCNWWLHECRCRTLTPCHMLGSRSHPWCSSRPQCSPGSLELSCCAIKQLAKGQGCSLREKRWFPCSQEILTGSWQLPGFIPIRFVMTSNEKLTRSVTYVNDGMFYQTLVQKNVPVLKSPRIWFECLLTGKRPRVPLSRHESLLDAS